MPISPDTPCQAPVSLNCALISSHLMATVWVFHDVSQCFTCVSWCFTMFSESRNDQYRCIGNRQSPQGSAIMPQRSSITPQGSAIMPQKWSRAKLCPEWRLEICSWNTISKGGYRSYGKVLEVAANFLIVAFLQNSIRLRPQSFSKVELHNDKRANGSPCWKINIFLSEISVCWSCTEKIIKIERAFSIILRASQATRHSFQHHWQYGQNEVETFTYLINNETSHKISHPWCNKSDVTTTVTSHITAHTGIQLSPMEK